MLAAVVRPSFVHLRAPRAAARARIHVQHSTLREALGACDPVDLCTPPFDASTERVRPYVRAALKDAGLPRELEDFILAWIRIETDGIVSATGNAAGGEYGYFQVSQEEATDMGIDAATLIASSHDPNLAMQIGLRLVKKHIADARALLAQNGASWPSPDFWKLVKAMHALPSQFRTYMQSYVANNGTGPTGWDDLVSWGQATYGHSTNYNLRRTDTIANANWVGSFAPASVDPMFAGLSTAKKVAIAGGTAASVVAAMLAAFALV